MFADRLGAAARPVFALVWALWSALVLALHRGLLEANKFVLPGPLRPSRSGTNRFANNLVVIGDAVALGFGDSVSPFAPTGVAHYLPLCAMKYSQIRTQWRAHCMGEYASTSADWAPGGRLFAGMAADPRFAASSLVVLAVGSQDGEAGISEETTAANINEICNALVAYGKRVYVVTFPNNENRARNDIVVRELQRSSKIVLAADLGGYRYRRSNMYWRGHLNWKGYHEVAKDVIERMVDDMVKVEFSKFSNELFNAASQKKAQ